jgi:hypothetical protein
MADMVEDRAGYGCFLIAEQITYFLLFIKIFMKFICLFKYLVDLTDKNNITCSK